MIQMLVQHNGMAPLERYSLGAAEEARLIALGLARAYSPGIDGVRSGQSQLTTADSFRNSGKRGMGIDPLSETPITDEYWDLLARFNVNLVRQFVPGSSQGLGTRYDMSAAMWNSLVVNATNANARGMTYLPVVVVNRPGVQDERRDYDFYANERSPEQFGDFWARISAALTGHDWAGDLLNEPLARRTPPDYADEKSPATVGLVYAMMAAGIRGIRSVNPDVACIVEPTPDGNQDGYIDGTLKPLPFDNVVYSLHQYNPMGLTHANVLGYGQTRTFPDSRATKSSPYSDSMLDEQGINARRIELELQAVANFASQYNVPIIAGEFSHARATAWASAPAFIRACIAAFEKLGFSWGYHAFGFPSSPWEPLSMPNSSGPVDIIDEQGSRQVQLGTMTGVGVIVGPSTPVPGRAPIAPIYNWTRRNKLSRFKAAAKIATQYAGNDFAAGGYDGFIANAGRLDVGNGATAVVDSVANLMPGDTHCALFTHGPNAGSAGAMFRPMYKGSSPNLYREIWFGGNVRLGQAIATGEDIMLLAPSAEGLNGGTEYMQLCNVTGTDTWYIEVWPGAGEYGDRVRWLIPGMSLGSAAWHRLKVGWINSNIRGRVVVMLDNEVLVDINTMPTVSSATGAVWCPKWGYQGTATGQSVAWAHVEMSVGADMVSDT